VASLYAIERSIGEMDVSKVVDCEFWSQKNRDRDIKRVDEDERGWRGSL
jgi:hypothetical protein